MAVIPAVVTDDARRYWPQFFGRVLGISAGATTSGHWNPFFRTFKVGEGGWIDPGGGPIPRSPDPNLRRVDNSIQDIDSIVDPTRPLIDQRYTASTRASFEKALTDSDMIAESPSIIRIRCLLDFTDFNDDGFSNSPEIWEIGIFSDHPIFIGQKLMVAYGTFPSQTKIASKQLENAVRIQF